MLKAAGVGYVVGGRQRGQRRSSRTAPDGARLHAGNSGRGRSIGNGNVVGTGERVGPAKSGEASGPYEVQSSGSPGADILRDIDVHIRPGSFVGVIGPNGAGKTTLMRVLAGILHPTSGEVLFEGRSVHRMSETERARSIAFMSQNPGIGFGFTVADVVAMGRYAHRRPWWRGGGRSSASDDTDSDGPTDEAVVEQAMAATEVGHLRERPVTNLSGGERQRVFLARTLAQQPRLLFLDEPTSDLDIRFQLEILELVRALHEERQLTVVMAIHDLTWALRYCDDILALQGGRVAADGPAEDVLTEHLIGDVFGVRAHIEQSTNGAPRVDFVDRMGG